MLELHGGFPYSVGVLKMRMMESGVQIYIGVIGVTSFWKLPCKEKDLGAPCQVSAAPIAGGDPHAFTKKL